MASRGTGAGRAGPVWGAVCSCATIVGGSPRGILDLMRGRGRGRLGVVVCGDPFNYLVGGLIASFGPVLVTE